MNFNLTTPFLLALSLGPFFVGWHSVLDAPIWLGNLVGGTLHPKLASSCTSAANSTVPSSSGDVAYNYCAIKLP